MKLVEILGKELKDWPAGVEELGQCYDGDLHICRGGAPAPEYLGIYVSKCEDMEEKVSRAQWKAERDRQKGGEWKRHRGGHQPVADDVVVEYLLRSGSSGFGPAARLEWNHNKDNQDVMKYREKIHKKEEIYTAHSHKKQSVFESRQPCDKPIIISSLINNHEQFIVETDQIDGPIKWRDQIVELEAHEEDIQREIASLHARLTQEGFSLVRQYPSFQQPEQTLDMRDWRNWKVGDILRTTSSEYEFSSGEMVRLLEISSDNGSTRCEYLDSRDYWHVPSDHLEFIARS